MDRFVPQSCSASGTGAAAQKFPVGMGYVPWQTWNQTYSREKALQRGTIFPELDLSFDYGRCRR